MSAEEREEAVRQAEGQVVLKAIREAKRRSSSASVPFFGEGS